MKKFLERLRHGMTTAHLQYKKIRLLPHVLSRGERLALTLCILVTLTSGFFLSVRLSGYAFTRIPASGGSYSEAIVGTPTLLNPLFAPAHPTDLDLTRLIYAGILRRDAKGNIVPDLAERFTVSPDQKTYTIALKKNIQWHDGEPVTADDVLFTIERIQNPEMKSPLAQSFRGVVATRVDNTTVQITLKEAFAPFIETLTTGIIPEHLWRDVPMATAQLAEYNLKPIGAGSFRFASFIKDKKGVIKSYTLERFSAYQARLPYLKEITLQFYPTFDEAKDALVKGEVNGLHFVPKLLKEKIPSGNYHAVNLSFPQYTAVFFNQEQNKALKDKNIRQALIAAVDRERIIRDVLGGEAALASGPFSQGSIDFSSTTKSAIFDPEKAGTLLTSAGWKIITREEYQQKIEREKKAAEEQEKKSAETTAATDAQKKNTLTSELRDVEQSPTSDAKEKVIPSPKEEVLLDRYREKNGAILTIRLSTIDRPENVGVAEIIRAGWEALGVLVTIDIRKENFQKDVIQSRDYEALLFGVVAGRDPDPYPFWHSSQRETPGLNLSLFANKEADALLEDARRTNDLGIRETKYKRFQEILSEAVPADFLYTPTYTYLIGNMLKGFTITNIAKPDDRFADIAEWHVKTRLALRKVEADSRR